MSSSTPAPPPVLTMTVGDVIKSIMSAFQQSSAYIQKTEPTLMTPPSPSVPVTSSVIPPTTITIAPSSSSSAPAPAPAPAPTPTTPTPPVVTAPQGSTTSTSSSTPASTSTPAPASSSPRHHDFTRIFIIAGAILVALIFITLAITDMYAFIISVIMIGLLTFVLYYYGFVQIETKPNELDMQFTVPTDSHPDIPVSTAPVNLGPKEEVFYVSDNSFTYDQAKYVCKAYNSELASYSQVEQAYTSGAEWCGYGWSLGGIALFPTQQSTWEKAQQEADPKKRIQCGRPGINGGYFDPKTKFGVNCYGARPQKLASSITTTVADPTADRLVGYFQKNLSKYVVLPFNGKTWSEYPDMSIQSSQTATPSAAPVPGSVQPSTPTAPTTSTTSPQVTSTLMSSSATTHTPPIAPPPAITTNFEISTSAPMGALNDTFGQIGSSLSNFVHQVV